MARWQKLADFHVAKAFVQFNQDVVSWIFFAHERCDGPTLDEAHSALFRLPHWNRNVCDEAEHDGRVYFRRFSPAQITRDVGESLDKSRLRPSEVYCGEVPVRCVLEDGEIDGDQPRKFRPLQLVLADANVRFDFRR